MKLRLKKKKICKGIFNDKECLTINGLSNNGKCLLVVYPKYLSKLKWFIVYL